MPEEQSLTSASLERLLDVMEDYTLEENNYQSIQKALELTDSVSIQAIKKLLLICVCDLKEDVNSTLNGLNILRTLLMKIKVKPCLPLPDLLPSAIVVLRMLKTTALFNKVETLKMLCFEIMSLYPDETLIALVVDQSNELMELFNLYCHQRIPPEIRIQPLCLVTTLLKILPPDKKATFVKEGLNIWFSKIIPTVMLCPTNKNVLETLELLTEEIVKFEYTDNQHWKNVLTCIYTPQKYPSVMKSLLEQGNEAWHRVWIVFIKLLKSQITKNTSTVGSPINSMLPVVETAFKMDVQNRCRAFKCWNVLIDNFSSETNEVYINKRIKLLIIPLLSNNAKVEETALAKLKTWWHLIKCFHSNMNNFSQTILVPFLHFCFGKPVSDKPVIIPGMISNVTKTECVKVFINVVGHGSCNGCVEYPKLSDKIIDPKVIVSHRIIWIHSLTAALRICIENDFKQEHIECVWKASLMTVGEISEGNVRRDIFNEVLAILEKLPRDGNRRDAEVINNILIPILFENNDKIRPLLETGNDEDSPVTKIIATLRLSISDTGPGLNVAKLRYVTDYLVDDAFKTSSHTIECLLKDLSSNNVSIWIALSQSICEQKYSLCSRTLCKMLLWPFNYLDAFVKNNEATSSWIELYKFLYPTLHMTTLSTDILNALLALNGTKYSRIFVLDVILLLLQQKLDAPEATNIDKEAQLLYKSVCNLNETDFPSILPTLSNIIVNICSSVKKNINEKIAKTTVLTAADVLKKSLSISESSSDMAFVINNLKKMLESLDMMFEMEKYSDLKLLLVDDLKNIAHILKKEEKLNQITEVIHKTSNKNDKFSELVKTFENDDPKNIESNKLRSKEKPSTPSNKVSNKNKKKETSIVNTVVENGEEFVVVKSNWKFNPRKLTDNQKEKLQRKREDIPALYQDLSQSQDDFKLTAWKSDSMDTSTGSKSASVQGNEDAKTILKNIPNNEFVPKMLENIIDKERDSKTKADSENESVKLKNNDKITKITSKVAKSPRMALKDRVFRNVRNLIEKSNVSENENTSNIMGNVSKTPSMTKTKLTTNLTNSAPSHINADRPTRVKRKPRKFDDLQIFSLKKRRYSAGLSDSPSDGEITDSPVEDVNAATVSKDNNVKEPIDPKDNEGENIDEDSSAKQSSKDIKTVEQKDDACDGGKKIGKEETIEITETCQENRNTEEGHTSDVAKTDPKASEKNKTTDAPKSSNKKSTKKSRIEKELAIDMVEGHPFLQVQSEKRLTRKAILNTPCTRKNLSSKLNKNKSEPKSAKRAEKKAKDLNVSLKQTQNEVDIVETQDVIESSQESTVSTVSVKTPKGITNKLPIVLLDNNSFVGEQSQNILSDSNCDVPTDITEDIELPRNKTKENLVIDLTENMDTETFDKSSEDVITINDEDESIMGENKNETVILETQIAAEADTESLDPNVLMGFNEQESLTNTGENISENNKSASNEDLDIDVTNASTVATPEDVTKTMTDSMLVEVQTDEACSSFKDEEQRKKDFLNNTLEISPIKTLSPCRDKKSPSPETSSDYVVVKLSSPVNINGEPISKCESPEIFTEDKESLDARDLSPPREEINVTNSSPRSSLSLKKNKPQVRQGGRGAQMLGLCVPDRIQTIITSEKPPDTEDTKKSPSMNTSARRNLRILYNSSSGDNNDGSETDKDGEESTTFLKFERSLPSVDCSPSVPILKRKLAEITDEATASPASKRKRVSFHDPPVSTTICVKKYIEPCGVRSPQNSAIKRQERQLRSQLPTRSPKRLDNVFKLDSVLTKTIESFNTELTEDTAVSSPDETAVLEVIKTSDINDTDPICLELVDCEDPVTNIAEELSSVTTTTLLMKEFEGKVAKIGDLARMTELEINRFSIKEPKIESVKGVLSKYVANNEKLNDDKTAKTTPMNESIVSEVPFNSIEIQTNEVTSENNEMQTDKQEFSLNCTQTDNIETNHCSSQTNETGFRTTADIVTNCLAERNDFVDNICVNLDETAKQKIAENLSFNALSDVIMKKVNSSNRNDFLHRIIKDQSVHSSTNGSGADKKLSVVQDYLCSFFESKELILFCSDLLRKVHEKPS
ncbi:hypothetical protein KGM_208111 [Danaus plexippus plexippus]|uniref:Uncharacterized protein n=1 Tax=Danaus plexippus plexippus TaxID=278856 RepID=A0A212FKD1_DANPL|nr:hypothetical protein KGM_208111 [Danaus plexippus plexippus]